VQRAFDEPSLGLAPLAVRQVFDRLAALRDTSVVIVEQDTRAALSVAARGCVLQQGRVVAEGPSCPALSSPPT
jgi:branched-chain amino acid transport system ATP-binding protein